MNKNKNLPLVIKVAHNDVIHNVPERNNLLADTYIQYVKDKKTVVFCASVFHAEEVAKLFKKAGVKAEAVSETTKSKDRDKILKNYENGDIQVLCACDYASTIKY